MRSSKKTLLLVDDEEMILRTAKRLLTKLGYEILMAASGEEALEVYRKNMTSIDLVMLDLTMPRMTGVETFDRLRAMDPNVKVMLCSGYSRDQKVDELLSRGAVGFLEKPFKIATLTNKLKNIRG